MEATAKLKFARISTRKARMVLDMVRGQNVAVAIEQLRFTRKAAAPMVGKLLGSAISNAQVKDDKVKLDKDLLARLKKVSDTAGYATVEEFITHVLEKELQQFADAASDEDIKNKLKGLGYIS